MRGLGNDIIEVGRIKSNIQKYGQRFLDRVYTAKEQDYCSRHKESGQHYAGRFAAKEAVVKALGTGLRRGLSWTDIEILNDKDGKPMAALSPKFQRLFDNPIIHVSISHCKEYATAVAVWM